MDIITCKRKPFKVANNDRQFKGIVVANLQELKERSLNCLSMSMALQDVSISLAEDGTKVDDEEYFSMLPENTKLIIAHIKEKAIPERDSTDGNLETSESQEVFNGMPSENVLKKLQNADISNSMFSVMNLSKEELDSLLDCDVTLLSHACKINIYEAKVILDTVENELSRRTELSEANKLLNLYQRAKRNQDLIDGVKRKK